jgi:hypothetical protein
VRRLASWSRNLGRTIACRPIVDVVRLALTVGVVLDVLFGFLGFLGSFVIAGILVLLALGVPLVVARSPG